MEKKILLTFDVEEFDLPEEYNIQVEKEEQLAISTQGLDKILALLRKHQVVATFFTTAYYAENNPCRMRKLIQEGHEVASHLYYHSDYDPGHLLASKLKIEEITGCRVAGFRSPRLRPMEPGLIKKAGYRYDSSLNPTYLPGRYNNLSKPRTLFENTEDGYWVLPFSVSPWLRFPLFWLSFKNLNFHLYTWLCERTLGKDNYLHLYFHPWEFTSLDKFPIPRYIKAKSGHKLVRHLDLLIQRLKRKGSFSTISDFLDLKEAEEFQIN
jgi:peptidoglycan/xylan/chitin deacetylase (PgdA/CDA1 family)